MQSTGKRAHRTTILSAAVLLILVFLSFVMPTAQDVHAQTTAVAVSAASSTATSTATKPKPTCTMTGNVNSGSITIRWSSKNATSAYITSAGSVGTSGVVNLVLPLSTASTYVGTFTGPGGTTTCHVSAAPGASGGSGGGSTGTSGTGTIGTTGTGGSTGATGTTDTSGTTGTNTTGATGNNTSVNTSSSGSGATVVSPNGGLVPCGISDNIFTATACSLCDFVKLIQNIITFLLGISTVIAVALFAYAGILFFTNAASVENHTKAKAIFRDVFVGFIIALMGYFVVQTLLSVLVNQNFFSGAGGSWGSLGSCTDPRPRDKQISELFGALTSNNAGGTSGSGVQVSQTPTGSTGSGASAGGGGKGGSPSTNTSITNMGEIHGSTAYETVDGEGGAGVAGGGTPTSVQDCKDATANGQTCQPITVAVSRVAGGTAPIIPFGTQFTWDALSAQYGLPAGTEYIVQDTYAQGWGNGTVDVNRCTTANVQAGNCFAALPGGKYSNDGSYNISTKPVLQ